MRVPGLPARGARRVDRERWTALAHPLELSPCPHGGTAPSGRPNTGPFALVGKHRGVDVELIPLRGGAALVRAFVEAPLPPGLWLGRTHQHTPPRLQDLTLGVPTLDEAYIIQSENPAAALRLLRAEDVRAALSRFLDACPDGRVAGPEVQLVLGREEELDGVRRKLRAAAELAAAMGATARAQAAEAHRERARTRSDEVPAVPSRRFVKVPLELLPFEQRVQAQMKRVRRQGLAIDLFSLLPFASLLLTGGLIPSVGAWPWFFGHLAALVGLTGAGQVLHRFLTRCPACRARLPAGWKLGKTPEPERTFFELRHCPRCGVLLRPPR